MKYLASNGITPSAILTEDEAREHYDAAPYVSGEFGQCFMTCPVGEYGRVLYMAATTFLPLADKSKGEDE